MREGVSVPSAVREVLASQRFVPVALLLTVAVFASDITTTTWASWVGAILDILVLGYQLSIARNVLDGGDALPPVIGQLPTLARRGLSVWGWAFAPLAASVALFIPLTLLLRGLGGIGSRGMFGILGAILLPLVFAFVVVVVGGRYIYFDLFGEGFHYIDASRHFGRFWRAGLVAVGFDVLCVWLIAAVRLGANSLLGGAGLSGAFGMIVALFAGHVSLFGMLTILGVLLVSVIAAARTLVSGHLIGQYSRLVYGPGREVDERSVEQAYRAERRQLESS